MIPGSANPLLLASAAAAGGYQVSRSLRFNAPDSAFLSRTPAVAGNRKTWTWAGWVKRSGSTSGNTQVILAAGPDNDDFGLVFDTDDRLHMYEWDGSFTWQKKSDQVFRDFSAWYHIVAVLDTSNATTEDRARLYVNGQRIVNWNANTNPSLDFATTEINDTQQHRIGQTTANVNRYLNGYLADIHFIDGQALTPSSFTEVSATTGQLIPKTYTGTFGTNGFWLKFSDNSNNTAATLGKDYSPNGNNWTPNNLSVTAGAGNDSLVDTPTSYGTDTGVGGSVRGNYATLNPLQLSGSNRITLSNGNLQGAGNSIYYGSAISTISVNSGKWYAEFTFTLASTFPLAGIIKTSPLSSTYQNSDDQLLGRTADAYGYRSDQNLYNNNSNSTYGASWTDGDAIGVALNLDAGTLTFYKNGVSQGQAASGLSGYYAIGCSVYSSAVCNANFGQRAFAYPLSGFKALCDTNLGAPLVAKPNTVFNVITYAGTGATQTLPNANSTPSTPLAFSPDFVWIKSRSNAANHFVFDVVRGIYNRICTSLTVAEASEPNTLTAFNSDGFSLGSDAGVGGVNTSSQTYVGWAWDAGTSTVSNTAGSITSQVRANVSAGFSVVTWSYGAVDATVGHGLGVAPGMIIAKARTGTSQWIVYHSGIGTDKYIYLSSTAAAATNIPGVFSSNSSTVFEVNSGLFPASVDYVAYCFAPVVGYSSAFTWSGTGSTDGPAIYLGFRPKLIIWKRTDSAANWAILDSSRSSYNVADDWLGPNSSSAESADNAAYAMDFLSNGLKIRATHEATNQSGGTYIGFAFAESPFQYARAR